MAQKGVVSRMNASKLPTVKDFPACVHGKITNTKMNSRRYVKMRSGAVVYTDVAEIYEHSLGGANYFITFIYEASGIVSAEHIKSKSEAA